MKEINQDTPLSEVKELAKLVNRGKEGYKEALVEMGFRFEEMQPLGVEVEERIWQNYWFEKAAKAGHIEAHREHTNTIINNIYHVMDPEWRREAMDYFQSFVKDVDADKLSEEQKEDHYRAKLWLGILLCEGYPTRPDAVEGVKLIEGAETFFKKNDFEEFGYKTLKKVGETYAFGYARDGREPSIADLGKAIEYLEKALEPKRYKSERDDPNNRGYLQMTKDLLETLKKQKTSKEVVINNIREISSRVEGYSVTVPENTTLSEAEKQENWERMTKISPAVQPRVAEEKAALARLRVHLAREGW